MSVTTDGKCSPQDYQTFLLAFAAPEPSAGKILQDGVGLITVPAEKFDYSTERGYCAELATMVEEGTGRRLLFIRVDEFDPAFRDENRDKIDYCIPMARPDATELERLASQIPFGGAWSDTNQAALLVFEEEWCDWFRGACEAIAVAVPNSQKAALIRFTDRDRAILSAFESEN